jgi:hypothetical protein
MYVFTLRISPLSWGFVAVRALTHDAEISDRALVSRLACASVCPPTPCIFRTWMAGLTWSQGGELTVPHSNRAHAFPCVAEPARPPARARTVCLLSRRCRGLYRRAAFVHLSQVSCFCCSLPRPPPPPPFILPSFPHPASCSHSCQSGSLGVKWYRRANNGSGPWQEAFIASIAASDGNVTEVHPADVNGDGLVDIIHCTFNTSNAVAIVRWCVVRTRWLGALVDATGWFCAWGC